MGSVIVSQTIGGIPDQRIGLQNSRFARPHGISPDWQTLRIALRVQMENTSANITGTPHFFFGLCSGTAAPMGSATPKHAVGFYTNTATWVYATAAGANMTAYQGNTTNSTAVAVTVNGTTTLGGTAIWSAQIAFGADPTAATRRMWFFDLTKGSPNYSCRVFGPSVLTAVPDVLTADFLQTIEYSAPVFTNHTYGASQSTGAVNETTNGTLDCVNVWWNQLTPKIHICDLAVFRLA